MSSRKVAVLAICLGLGITGRVTPAGALADNYVLTESTSGIIEKYWKLVELNGKPVPPLQREPFLILKTDGRVAGFGGCNNFTGSYTADEAASRIRPEQNALASAASPAEPGGLPWEAR